MEGRELQAQTVVTAAATRAAPAWGAVRPAARNNGTSTGPRAAAVPA